PRRPAAPRWTRGRGRVLHARYRRAADGRAEVLGADDGVAVRLGGARGSAWPPGRGGLCAARGVWLHRGHAAGRRGGGAADHRHGRVAHPDGRAGYSCAGISSIATTLSTNSTLATRNV